MASWQGFCGRSIATAVRSCRSHVPIRAFHALAPRAAASNFTMPAMSPTMTEGNISAWKVKEGDSFTAGDVLLEIETDKAQMDVEAQEDGVMAKIIQGDGSKSVKVGSRIAVLAEEGDDISSLEIPAEDTVKSQAPAKETKSSSSEQSSGPPKQEESRETSQPLSPPRESGGSTAAKAQKQTYPPFPSVQQLLHQNGLSNEDSDRIPASGPNGRLTKGDVLAYLGQITKSYPHEESSRLSKLSHLDLSNIQLAAPKKPTAAEVSVAAAAQAEVEAIPAVSVVLPINLTAALATQKKMRDALGVTLPLSTFIARASEVANDQLPRARGSHRSAEELFDIVVGKADEVGTSFSTGNYIPELASTLGPLPVPAPPAPRKTDVYDVLTGRQPVARRATAVGLGTGEDTGATNLFSVTVPPNERQRAQVYLSRLKLALETEPGRLVL